MDTTYSPLSKDQLRSLYKTVRSHVGSNYAAQAAQAVIKSFMRDVPLAEGSVVAGYMAVQHELDVMPLLGTLIASHICALPVVTGPYQPLEFRQWDPAIPLIQNKYHIAEPDKSAALVVPDVIIVPLLACDKTGTRLGYGKGYYDITLAALERSGKKLQKIGVCYQCQMVDELLPCDENDYKLDMVITEKGLCSF